MSETREVVVTGGGTGIGREIATEFASLGDHVTVTGRREQVLKDAVDQIGGGAGYLSFDASDPAAVAEALAGLPVRVDVLVNNAGGNQEFAWAPEEVGASGAAAQLADVAARWRANLTANLLSTVLMTAALTPRLTDGGRVIAFSSIGARRNGGSYGAAKAAVEAWAANAAAELGPQGITVNVVSPGFVTGTEFFRDGMTSQREQPLIAETRNQRAGTPADVAAIVVFLAGPAAGHITGQVIHVNGG